MESQYCDHHLPLDFCSVCKYTIYQEICVHSETTKTCVVCTKIKCRHGSLEQHCQLCKYSMIKPYWNKYQDMNMSFLVSKENKKDIFKKKNKVFGDPYQDSSDYFFNQEA